MAPSAFDLDLESPPLDLASNHTRNPTSVEAEFLKLYTGDALSIRYKKAEGLEFLQHMSSLVGTDALDLFRQALQPTYHASCGDLERILWALCAMIKALRAEPTISIFRLAARLADQVFQIGTEPESDFPARRCLISLIGWSSLLFIPMRTISEGTFDLDTQGASCFSRSSIQLDNARRPIDELLRGFGELLPKKHAVPETHTTGSSSLKFHVSNLNIATLKKLAKIELIWVDAVSAHLAFDPTAPSLCIFKAPSYCKLNSSSDTFLSIVTKDFYTEGERPTEDFSPQDLMREIILSYGLLIQNWRLARKLYRKERIRASTTGPLGRRNVDPWLDKLCGMNLPSSILSSLVSKHGIRETYDAKSQFPILSDRLKTIQDYMEGIQPSRVSSLWHDRRDLRLWYTVWVVLIIGGISILQAAVSIFLSVIQVAYAAKAYELQEKQTPATTST